MPQNINLLQNISFNDLKPQKEFNSFKTHGDKTQEFDKHLNETEKRPERNENNEYKTNDKDFDNKKLEMARKVADELEGETDDENIIDIIEDMMKIQDATEDVMPLFNFNNLDQITLENDKLLVPVDLTSEKIKLINDFMNKSDIKLNGKIKLISNSDFKQIDLTKLAGDSVKNTDQNLLNNVNAQKGVNNNSFLENISNKATKEITQPGIKQILPDPVTTNNNMNTDKLDLKTNTGESASLLNGSAEANNNNNQNIISTSTLDSNSPVSGINNSNKSGHTMELATKSWQIETENLFDRTVMNQIVKKVSFDLSKDSNEIKINLKPPSLGKMEIKISVEGNNVKAIMVTENSLVKDIVESNLAQLKNSLLEQGLKVDQFSVLVGDNNQFSDGSKRGYDELFDENGERKIRSGRKGQRYNITNENIARNVGNIMMSNDINDRLDIFA